MRTQAIKSVKEVFENESVIITKILQGSNGRVRIDARTKFHVDGKDNFFSKWVSFKYANNLAREYYGTDLFKFRQFHF